MTQRRYKSDPSKANSSRPQAPCCGQAEKRVVVEYLYLDLQTCKRCIGTDVVLEEVLAVLSPALALAGYRVEFKKTEMKTAEIAKEYRFISSPTIRVNGRDIGGAVQENSCGCCSEISGTDVDCRVYEYDGENFEVPPKEMLAQGILKAVFATSPAEQNEYELPQNLRTFFEGKKTKCACSGGGSCCG